MLSYVVGILEDLGEDEDGFDVEGFTEMLAAYIPEFSEIRPEQVCEWIFGLSAELAKRRKGECLRSLACLSQVTYFQPFLVLFSMFLGLFSVLVSEVYPCMCFVTDDGLSFASV